MAVARLLIRRPPIILADEPTGALDEANAARVLAHLRDFADAGCCVIVATHAAEVVAFADAEHRLPRR